MALTFPKAASDDTGLVAASLEALGVSPGKRALGGRPVSTRSSLIFSGSVGSAIGFQGMRGPSFNFQFGPATFGDPTVGLFAVGKHDRGFTVKVVEKLPPQLPAALFGAPATIELLLEGCDEVSPLSTDTMLKTHLATGPFLVSGMTTAELYAPNLGRTAAVNYHILSDDRLHKNVLFANTKFIHTLLSAHTMSYKVSAALADTPFGGNITQQDMFGNYITERAEPSVGGTLYERRAYLRAQFVPAEPTRYSPGAQPDREGYMPLYSSLTHYIHCAEGSPVLAAPDAEDSGLGDLPPLSPDPPLYIPAGEASPVDTVKTEDDELTLDSCGTEPPSSSIGSGNGSLSGWQWLAARDELED